MRHLEFPPTAQSTNLKPQRRLLGDKLQEIGSRSPKDINAFDALADMVLERLNAEPRQQNG